MNVARNAAFLHVIGLQEVRLNNFFIRQGQVLTLVPNCLEEGKCPAEMNYCIRGGNTRVPYFKLEELKRNKQVTF